VFEANTAAVAGGAIHASGTHLTLEDCHFVDNWATGLGGAIQSVDSDLSLTGCTFMRNAGHQGGAIHHQQGTLTLADCRFEANVADRQGGAIDLNEQQSASMVRCTFRRNWTSASGSGGAIANGIAPLFLDGCSFSGNRARQGGAIATDGPSPFDPNSQAEGTVMVRCLFTGNSASDAGGALWVSHAGFTILNCTFAQNKGYYTGSTLAWPFLWGDRVVCRVAMENCIVWDGTGPISVSRSGIARRPWPGEEQARAEVTIRYSNVQGGWAGEGNIDADPLFADPGYWAAAANPNQVVTSTYAGAVWIDGDYRLKSQAGRWDPASATWVQDDVTSPCIDAGDPDSPVGDEPEPNGGRINLGAYGGTSEASQSRD
jgi:predicted outer membrane repeat protein